MVTLDGVPLYIAEDHLGFFYVKFGDVSDVSLVKCKTGIATTDFEIMITLTWKNFMNIPKQFCGSRPIYIAVKCHRSICWSCGIFEILPLKEAGTTTPTIYQQRNN